MYLWNSSAGFSIKTCCIHLTAVRGPAEFHMKFVVKLVFWDFVASCLEGSTKNIKISLLNYPLHIILCKVFLYRGTNYIYLTIDRCFYSLPI
jgi:hypothetical protein